jgi:hypothetical protein
VRRVWWFAAVLLFVAAGACSKCGSNTDANLADVAEPPVPAPEALIADVYVSTPNASWGRLQRGIGGAVGILPPGVGGMVCTTCGIDFSFSDEIDGTAPAFAVVAGDPADPTWALALKLTDVRRARGALAGDDTSRFNAKELGNGVTEMVPKQPPPPGTPPPTTVGLTKNGYLVVVKREPDLARLAPYVTRTLPSRPLPAGAIAVDVPRSAIDKILAPKLDAAWNDGKIFLLAQDARMRKAHGGRPPDYGDADQIVAAIDAIIGRRLAIVHDLEKMRLSFEVGDQNVTIDATLTPVAGGATAAKWVGGMKTGDAKAVLALPQASAIAFTTRDNEDDRAAQAAELEKSVTQSLGTRISEADTKKLHDVVSDWTTARGETLGASVVWDEPRSYFLRAAVKDGDAADRAVRAMLDLARAPPFKEMLRTKDIAFAHEEAAPLGKVSVATITRMPRDGGAPPPRLSIDAGVPRANEPIAVAWTVENEGVDVASGEEAKNALVTSARPEKKLGEDPSVRAAVTPLGSTASTILVAQPLRFDPKRANLGVAPLVIGVGKKDSDAYVRIDVSDGLLREVSRFLMGI